MRKINLILGSLIISSFSFAGSLDSLEERICFNDNDAAATGMTSVEYYEAIKSSCDEQIKISVDN